MEKDLSDDVLDIHESMDYDKENDIYENENELDVNEDNLHVSLNKN